MNAPVMARQRRNPRSAGGRQPLRSCIGNSQLPNSGNGSNTMPMCCTERSSNSSIGAIVPTSGFVRSVSTIRSIQSSRSGKMSEFMKHTYCPRACASPVLFAGPKPTLRASTTSFNGMRKRA